MRIFSNTLKIGSIVLKSIVGVNTSIAALKTKNPKEALAAASIGTAIAAIIPPVNISMLGISAGLGITGFLLPRKDKSATTSELNITYQEAKEQFNKNNNADSVKHPEEIDKISMSLNSLSQNMSFLVDYERRLTSTQYTSEQAEYRGTLIKSVREKFNSLIQNITEYKKKIPKDGIDGYKTLYKDKLDTLNARISEVLKHSFWTQRNFQGQSPRSRVLPPALVDEVYISSEGIINSMTNLTAAISPEKK